MSKEQSATVGASASPVLLTPETQNQGLGATQTGPEARNRHRDRMAETRGATALPALFESGVVHAVGKNFEGRQAFERLVLGKVAGAVCVMVADTFEAATAERHRPFVG